MKGVSASSKKLAPTSIMRLLREHSKALADGFLQHPYRQVGFYSRVTDALDNLSATLSIVQLSGVGLKKLELNADYCGTHSMHRTKATLIYARTKNIRAVQILLGHSKLDNTIRYLGVKLEDALSVVRENRLLTDWSCYRLFF